MRLIDVDAADVDEINCFYGDECCLEDVEEWLNKQPTIDAEPIRHGRCEYCKDGKTFIGAIFHLGNDGAWHKINYCPNCGAKMDGGGSRGKKDKD